MKILVALKQVPHQDARLDVNGDGTWVKEDGIKFEINSYDTYALEEALRIKDAGEAEVVVASIGPDRVTQALRTALGMGADRAVHVKDDATDGSDALGNGLARTGQEYGARADAGRPGPVIIICPKDPERESSANGSTAAKDASEKGSSASSSGQASTKTTNAFG